MKSLQEWRPGGVDDAPDSGVFRPDDAATREEPLRVRFWSRPLGGKWATEVFVVAVLYCGAASLSLRLAFEKTNASPVWPPSGIALVAVLLLGYRVWPGIMLGAFFANVVTFLTNQAAGVLATVTVSSVIGIGNTLEAVAGRLLLHRWVGARCPFSRAQDVFKFTAVAHLACLVSSSIGPTAIALAGMAQSAGYGTIWFTWWLGDAAGVLLVAPLLITWSTQPQPSWTLGKRIEAALLFLSLLIAAHVGFGGGLLGADAHYPLVFVPLPWLVWSALRFDPRGAATATAVTSGIAVWNTVNGLGPFVGGAINESLLLLQAFVGVVTVTILTMAAVVAERREAQVRLRKAHDSLETLVEERTRALVQVNEMLQAEITERGRASEALRESESQYRLLAENVTDVIFVYDMNLRPVYVSPSVTRLRGYSVEEAVAQSLKDRLTPASAALALKTFAEVLTTPRGGAESRTLELEVTRKDGSTVWTETHMSFLRDSEGRPSGILGVARDITERKRAAEEHTELEAQLRQTQKLEAIGHLAAGVAHDFNNLLTVIRGRSQLVLKRLPSGDPRWRDIELIQKTCDRAARLVEQLLAFSRKQIIQPKVLDLNAVLGGMMDMLRRVIGEDIELTFVAAPDLGRARADLGQVEQVIMNLALNARDAMPNGGRLTIETADVDLDQGYAGRHVSVRPGAYVRLSVSDTGLGMDEKTRVHLFEPFFTTKELGKGTGLGLATVYGIVKQSGGNIWVYSEVGHGTTFKIYFPQVQESADTLVERRAAKPPRGGTETVLLVEDEDEVRELTREMLEDLGYTVLAARRPRDAMRVSEQHHSTIHLMLADVVMPEINGRQLAERLMSGRPDMKVLYMSGYTDDAIVRHGVLEPGTRFLEKPFSQEILADKVREALDETPEG